VKVYQGAHPETEKKRSRAWRAANRDRFMWLQAKNRAKRLGKVFSISVEDVRVEWEKALVSGVCPYLGIRLVFEGPRQDGSPSLDRIDPNLGYEPGNIAVVSFRANVVKNDGTVEEHLKIAEAVAQFLRHST
jgi:hypothetical protein